ncbi:MAG: transglycosylase SLT domain-containing protein [Myxococcales bacterium]|nr:transglycosylase SLT domain-containing protein [Myxococcales bacterium]MCB9708307.1 transglycosylase SLT domain-containing protein [Myxococcales bacterium]
MRPLAYVLPWMGALILATGAAAHDIQASPANGSQKQTEPSPLPNWFQRLEMPEIPIRMEERVIDYLIHYHDDVRGQQRIQASFERAAPYEGVIRAQLRSLELPEDLFYVTLVESGGDPSARSRKGAVGPWQFVRRTASHYKLTRNRWHDARMDPERSTLAAGRYLTDLHHRFGTWELALAAYNMGPGALSQAIRKYNTNDYALLSQIEAGLPYETVCYVARILAYTIAGNNRTLFGMLAEPRDTAMPAPLEVKGGTHLRLLAKAAGIPGERLYALNPGLLRHRTPPGHGYWRVWVPKDTVETVLNSPIARQIRKVKPSSESIEVSHSASGALAHARRKRRASVETTVVAVPAREFSYPDRTHVFFPVTRPTQAHELAARFGVLLKDICLWNHIDFRAPIQPGMVLQLFLSHAQAETASDLVPAQSVRALPIGSTEFFDHHETARKRQRIIYIARPGDTLRSLARRYELSVRSLSRINRFSRHTDINPGQQLVIYAPRS